VEIRLGGQVVRRVALEAGTSAQVVVPVDRPGTTCLLTIAPDNALGVTQVGFAR
jgi:hypothetical protein